MALALVSGQSGTHQGVIEQGRALAEANCSRCHTIEKTGDSLFAPAPPFRIIARIYNPEDLRRAFSEGLVVEHPAMPVFDMTPEQAAAIAAFIGSLERE